MLPMLPTGSPTGSRSALCCADHAEGEVRLALCCAGHAEGEVREGEVRSTDLSTGAEESAMSWLAPISSPKIPCWACCRACCWALGSSGGAGPCTAVSYAAVGDARGGSDGSLGIPGMDAPLRKSRLPYSYAMA